MVMPTVWWIALVIFLAFSMGAKLESVRYLGYPKVRRVMQITFAPFFAVLLAAFTLNEVLPYVPGPEYMVLRNMFALCELFILSVFAHVTMNQGSNVMRALIARGYY